MIDRTDQEGMKKLRADGRWPNVNVDTIADKWGLLYSPLGYAAATGNSEMVRTQLALSLSLRLP